MIRIIRSNTTLQYTLASFLSIGGFLIIWEIIVRIGDVSPLVLAKPSEIAPIITFKSDILLEALIFSLVEILAGWIIGNILAIILAIIIFNFKNIASFFVSFSVLINAIPIIALAAILGGIIGTDQFGKTIIVAILCFFPMFISTLSGFTTNNSDLDNLLNSFGSNKKQKFIKMILPGSLPFIFTTFKVNVITAIFAAIVSEFFGAHGGIGALILEKKGLYDLSMVWAAIFYIIISGSIFYFSISVFERIIIPWRK
jgi:NitT/TauT family transport system permease protein